MRSKAILSALLLVLGCTPLRMGETQATLVDLVNRQAGCDKERASGSSLDQRRATECIEISDALVKMSTELAEEAGKTGTSRPNAVFFYRRAATAAWRSEAPKAMQDAITYANAATRMCPQPGEASEVPPGDCAVAALVPALVTHDQGMIAYRPLSQLAGLPDADARRAHLLGKDFGGKTWPADAPLAGASKNAYDGWKALRDTAAKKACDKGIDQSVRDYVQAVHSDMVKNLHSMSQTMANAASLSYADTDAKYGEVCTTNSDTARQQGTAFHVRANDELWCRWQYAKRNAPACPVP